MTRGRTQPEHAERILSLLDEMPGASYRNLAGQTGLALSTVYDTVSALVADGRLDRARCSGCGRRVLLVAKKGA